MKIKFLHSIASAEGWAHPPGQPVDFHDDELARKFIASGIAVAVEDPVEETTPETGRRKKKS
jgi:hypothetical protein